MYAVLLYFWFHPKALKLLQFQKELLLISNRDRYQYRSNSIQLELSFQCLKRDEESKQRRGEKHYHFP